MNFKKKCKAPCPHNCPQGIKNLHVFHDDGPKVNLKCSKLLPTREFLNDKKVKVQLVCSFRYGREVRAGGIVITGVNIVLARMRKQWDSTSKKS